MIIAVLPALALGLVPAQSVEIVAEGLEVPWDIEPVSATRTFVLERPGRVRLIENGRLRPEPYGTIPGVVARGQGGLHDLVPYPDYARSKLVAVSYTVRDANGLKLRVSRFRDTGTGLRFDRTLFEGPSKRDPAHFGGRMAFGPQGKLFITHGERHDRQWAQDLGRINGKVLRINPDGSIPRDNPFYGRAGARKEVWSYGHRNPQGIAFDPTTGVLAVSEHGPSTYDGPRGYDEVNILRRGSNYGWPRIWGDRTAPGMRVPDYFWTEATAPGGLAMAKGQIAVPCLGSRALYIGQVVNGKITGMRQVVGNEHGRIRAAAYAPDGSLYFSTSNGERGRRVDRIMRLVSR
jgi:quinoprotein glucose dehydrogenase